jgi:Neutral/alkaline non-lysosomal ceramidase, N-terminal
MNRFAVAILILAMLAIGAFWSLAPAGAQAQYKVGMAKVDITPDPTAMTVTLNGYGGRGKAPATGVLDPIHARALVITDRAGRKAALLSVDLCFINSEVHELAIARLKAHGFDEHNVMISATHTHSGPSAYDHRWIVEAVMGPFDQRILDQVVGGIVEATLAADAAAVPATVAYNITEVDGLNRSRRDPAFSVEVGSVEGVTPNPDKYQTDRRLTVFRFDTLEGKPLGAVVHFASHPTVLSPESTLISADWPGWMNKAVEEYLGENTVSLFVNGALGDAAPMPDWSTPAAEVEATKEYAAQMTAAVRAQLEHTEKLTTSAVLGFTNRAVFDRVKLQALGGMPMHKGFSKVVYLRPDQPFQALRLGRFVILGVPGEPTTLTARGMEQLCTGDFHCLTAGPVNGYLGYFVVPEVYDEGGYAGSSCFWGRDTAARVTDAIRPAAIVVQSQL